MGNELEFLSDFATIKFGTVEYQGKKIDAEIEKKEGAFILRINEIIDFDSDEAEFDFKTEFLHLSLEAFITAHKNSITVANKLMSRYSEGKVNSIKSSSLKSKEPHFLRCNYYLGNNRLLFDYFGFKSSMRVEINGDVLFVSNQENYIVLESAEQCLCDIFSENCYSTMVAIGFVTGNFIQDECHIFQRNNINGKSFFAYEYRKLRSSSYSICHALTYNPFGYKDLISQEYAEQLYTNDILKPFDEVSFAKLAALIENSSQIQYALVLFNEANNRSLSLLIKNNCFFAVLEVLRKFFHEKFKDKFQKEHSQKSNIEKYKLVFGNLISLTQSECDTLEKRNVFLHGDIKDMECSEMVDVMYKQVSLIYRLVLSFVGYNGYVIDHYALRNNMPDKAFVKLN